MVAFDVPELVIVTVRSGPGSIYAALKMCTGLRLIVVPAIGAVLTPLIVKLAVRAVVSMLQPMKPLPNVQVAAVAFEFHIPVSCGRGMAARLAAPPDVVDHAVVLAQAAAPPTQYRVRAGANVMLVLPPPSPKLVPLHVPDAPATLTPWKSTSTKPVTAATVNVSSWRVWRMTLRMFVAPLTANVPVTVSEP